MKDELKNKLPKGFKLINTTDNFIELVNYAKRGAIRGVDLGFKAIQEFYTMSIPGVTDWTGFPMSGKSQLLLEFLLNTSIFYGWKHLIYMPDVGNETEIMADLIHKKTGKTFDKRYQNHITEKEISNAGMFIDQHFFILTKEDLKAKMSPYEFWDYAVELKKSIGIHTATIDAWKDLRHDTHLFAREDKYLEDVLSYRNALAEKHKLHIHTIIHPTRTEKDKNGFRKAPTPYDIKGGTEWFNNGKSIITVHRPQGEDKKAENIVEIYFNKIKPRSIGSVGMAELYFDVAKFRYYEEINGKRKYARKELDAEINPDDVKQFVDFDIDPKDIPF
ncbi:MAG: hypothetical protein GXO49_04675 [Chlorobi bacterium]|nr:hypothetical protein [Chlorobiota bacterium]